MVRICTRWKAFWYQVALHYNAESDAEVAQLARAQPCQG